MQAEEVSAWLEEPSPSTRDILVVVPDTSSLDASMYIAVPEREAWQSCNNTTDTPYPADHSYALANTTDQQQFTVPAAQFLVMVLFCLYIIGNIIQFLVATCSA